MPYSKVVYAPTPQVYCITKPDSPNNLGSFNDKGPSLIKGPYSSTNQDMMNALGDLEGVHFVYVITKHGK